MRPVHISPGLLLLGVLLMGGGAASAQEVPPTQPSQQGDEPLPPPRGKVLFSTEYGSGQADAAAPDTLTTGPADVLPKPAVTDAERAAVRIVGYDLDVHVMPAEARELVRATVTVRNAGPATMSRIPLQLSSTLRFQAVSTVVDGKTVTVPFTESPVATDADHTGYAQEAVISPAAPLPAGATLVLHVLYEGTIAQSSARLELLGVAPDKAARTDWDRIAPTSDASATALRGFPDVLWYPVASPLALLGDGNRLFALAGEQRLLNQDVPVQLRLTVEYEGDPPEGAIFNGELRPLERVADGQDELVERSRGVATADFARRPLGFRTPSLFLTAQKPLLREGAVVEAITADPEAAVPYVAAAARVQTLEADWFGVSPVRPLLLLDHPGQPFQDEALVVGQLAADAEVDRTARLLVGPLTAAWFRSGHPWIEDGLAELMRLLWTEREAGRAAAQKQLQGEVQTLALLEPAGDDGAAREPVAREQAQPLLHTSQEVLYRVKAAAVWWQLRDILGEETLRQGLQSYRHSESLNPAFDRDPKSMQRALERVSGKQLEWFFADWVYRDRGLPDLSIVQVNTRALPARAGRETGYLVAVEVRNAGGAVAEVPVTVSSGNLTATERLRVAAGDTASVRIVFEGTPERVEVNDGSAPEVGQPEHVFLVRSPQ